jgi:hypothetical protein
MKRLILSLLIGISLAACKKEDTYIANSAIDAKTRAAIKSKNDSLILALTTGKQRIFKRIANEHFLNNVQVQTKDIYRMFMYGVLDGNYTVYDEYEVRDKKPHDYIVLNNDIKGYTFSYTTPTDVSYVCIMEFGADKDKGALAAIYGLEAGKWKLDRIDAFIISADGKTPVRMYDIAKNAEEDGDIYKASYYATNAAHLIETYEKSMFQYKEAKAITLYKNTIQAKIKGPEEFPYVMEDIATKPAIVRMFMQPYGESKMKYTITYKTSIPVTDMDKLKAENKKVMESAQKFYTGLDFKNSIVEYKAVNLDADGEMILDSYRFY